MFPITYIPQIPQKRLRDAETVISAIFSLSFMRTYVHQFQAFHDSLVTLDLII